jgi:hypothetical protein
VAWANASQAAQRRSTSECRTSGANLTACRFGDHLVARVFGNDPGGDHVTVEDEDRNDGVQDA